MTQILKTAFFGAMMVSAFGTAQAAPVPEKTLNCTPSGGKVEFEATGRPSLLKIHGKSAGPECKLRLAGERAQGDLSLDLDQLDTGIETRTHHMKEKYLETARYKTARLTLDPLTLPPVTSSSKPVDFTGTLELHGVKKPVKGTVLIAREGADQVKGAQADFEVLLTDYGIAIPQFAGVTVSEKVQIHVVLDKLEVASQ